MKRKKTFGEAQIEAHKRGMQLVLVKKEPRIAPEVLKQVEKNPSRWHWVKFKSETDAEYAPALVDYENGKPKEVWIAGDFPTDADRCDIAEEIVREKP